MTVIPINHNNKLDPPQNDFYLERFVKSSKAELRLVIKIFFDYLDGAVNDPERSSVLNKVTTNADTYFFQVKHSMTCKKMTNS